MNLAPSLKLLCLLMVFLVLLLPFGGSMPREVLAGLLLLAACLDASHELKAEENSSRLVADWLSALISPRVLPFYAALIGLAWTGLMLAAPMRVQPASPAASSLCGAECGSHSAKAGGAGCVGCGSRQAPSQVSRTAVSIPVPSAAVRPAQPLPPVLKAKSPPPGNLPPETEKPATPKLVPPGSAQLVPQTTVSPPTSPEPQKVEKP